MKRERERYIYISYVYIYIDRCTVYTYFHNSGCRYTHTLTHMWICVSTSILLFSSPAHADTALSARTSTAASRKSGAASSEAESQLFFSCHCQPQAFHSHFPFSEPTTTWNEPIWECGETLHQNPALQLFPGILSFEEGSCTLKVQRPNRPTSG